jgi:prepilin-type N-terminal cleavage/methylation domain-containing protein
MVRVREKLNSEAGVTLVELMVVVLIIVVIASIAFMSPARTNEQLKRQNAARDLKTAFERARFDSVKRRADSSGSPSVPHAYVRVDSATQFTLVTDNNSDGDLTDALDTVVTTLPAGITIASDLTIPATISFDRRGEPSVADVSFVVCHGTCDFSNDTPAIANVIHVTPTGTVNMLPGGSTVPTFTAPNVSNVNTSTSIRSETYVAPSP